MNATTRKATASVALKGAQRVWDHLAHSDRAELADAARRIASAANLVHRALAQKGSPRSSTELRLALAQLGAAVSAAVTLMSEPSANAHGPSGRHTTNGSLVAARSLATGEDDFDAEFNAVRATD